jgi:hypothetical protein
MTREERSAAAAGAAPVGVRTAAVVGRELAPVAARGAAGAARTRGSELVARTRAALAAVGLDSAVGMPSSLEAAVPSLDGRGMGARRTYEAPVGPSWNKATTTMTVLDLPSSHSELDGRYVEYTPSPRTRRRFDQIPVQTSSLSQQIHRVGCTQRHDYILILSVSFYSDHKGDETDSFLLRGTWRRRLGR